MTDGLDINEKQFMQLKSKERDVIIFKNMVYIRKQFKDYTFHKKVQYVWLSTLTLINGTYLGMKGWFI